MLSAGHRAKIGDDEPDEKPSLTVIDPGQPARRYELATLAAAVARAAMLHAVTTLVALFAMAMLLTAILTVAARGAAVSMTRTAMRTGFMGGTIGVCGAAVILLPGRTEIRRGGEIVVGFLSRCAFVAPLAAEIGVAIVFALRAIFTPALLAAARDAGIAQATLTLHIGPGTFLPIRDGDLERYRMGPERYELPAATVGRIAAARAAGGLVVAVGTTTVRAL